jgi:hypothetical protein
MIRWDALSHEEQCLMVNAREHDLLPGVMGDWRTDLEPAERFSRYGELATVLIDLVDRGLIEVRRLSENDEYEVIGRADLAEALADPATWEYTDHNWIHRDEGLAIVETPAGKQLSRGDTSGVPDPQSSNPHLPRP